MSFNSGPGTISFFFGVFLCLFFSAAGFAGCAPGKLAAREIIITRNGSALASLEAEIARTDEERSRGLMYRKKVNEGEGMLFVFEGDQVLSFWMKNTLVPLSIAFISSDGRIVEIKDMRPLDLSPVKSSRSVRYALEVPQGWFARAGVQSGDVVSVGE